jgi:prepilin-type N-terminal cleavage/methylation domain-containing protein
MHRRRGAGFTLIEILFAIAILGVGIVGILSLFISGISAASWANSRSAAAMQAQSMFGQVLAATDPVAPTKRLYLERMKKKFFNTVTSNWITDPAVMTAWVHNVSDSDATPVAVVPGSDFYWQCLSANYMLAKDDPLNATLPVPAPKVNAAGLVEVVIAVYKSYRPGKPPISVYATLLTLEAPEK